MFLHKAQQSVSADRHRFRVICSGRRFGKTVLSVEEIKACALNKPARIVYLAPTFEQARDIAWEMLKKETVDFVKNVNESRLELRVWTEDHKDETYIALKSWESVESLRGQWFDLIIMDEVAMYRNFKVNFQEIILPTLTDTHGEVIFISTPKGFNHFYDLYNEEQTNPDFKSFHFTTYDNPHMAPEEIQLLKNSMTEDAFAQEYMADFRKMQGLVYKEFDRAKHVYTELPKVPFTETIAGVDFGFTNPCAILTIKRDYDGAYWVDDEVYEKGKTDAQIAELVAGMAFNKVYPDPENPAAIKELTDRRVNVCEVVKGKDSVKNGINQIRELLKSGRLHINARCGNLIWELETYAYPDKKDQRNEDELPIKENDHACDALRYPLMMQVAAEVRRFNLRPIQRIPANLNRRPIYQVENL